VGKEKKVMERGKEKGGVRGGGKECDKENDVSKRL
jgi:hypothetical protein